MDDHRKVQKRRERELAAEGGLLHIGWRAASGEIHPDLADGDDAAIPRELRDPIERLRSPRGGAMWMHADRRADAVVACGERDRLLARRDILRRRQDALDAGLSRALEHIGDVVREAAI